MKIRPVLFAAAVLAVSVSAYAASHEVKLHIHNEAFLNIKFRTLVKLKNGQENNLGWTESIPGRGAPIEKTKTLEPVEAVDYLRFDVEYWNTSASKWKDMCKSQFKVHVPPTANDVYIRAWGDLRKHSCTVSYN
jgi:hypothetical protein